jgi:uncharacterized membrane protein
VSNPILIILVAIGMLVLALVAFLIIRRQRYVRPQRGHGWTFEIATCSGHERLLAGSTLLRQ